FHQSAGAATAATNVVPPRSARKSRERLPPWSCGLWTCEFSRRRRRLLRARRAVRDRKWDTLVHGTAQSIAGVSKSLFVWRWTWARDDSTRPDTLSWAGGERLTAARRIDRVARAAQAGGDA